MSQFVLPVAGSLKITSPFGWRKDPVTKKNTKHHNGDDVVTSKKVEPILSFADGKVLKARKSTAANGGFGWYVIVQHKIHGEYYTSLYAHMEEGSLKVKPGQKIKAGTQLGIMGATGYVTGKHLHFEIWKGKAHGWSDNGVGFVNPIAFVKSLIATANIKADAPNPTPVPVAKPKTYKVKSGDTLTKIAAANKTTVAVLKKLNSIKDVNIIKVGQVIKLP